MKNTYWLADRPEKVISQLEMYDTQWRTYQGNPFYDMWFRNSYAYYSTILDADSVISAINFRGEKGELVSMKVPQARSLIRQSLTLMTKQRLSFQVIAEMDDYEFIQNMRKADAILTKEVKDGSLDIKRDLAGEQGLVMGTAFYACLHRFDKGKQIGMSEAGGAIFEGEPEIMVVHPIDMLYDFRLSNFSDVPWARVTMKRNRYDYMAMYPDLADKIAALPSCWERSAQIDQFFAADDRDSIYVYAMIHRPSPAIPEGRYLEYSDDATIYYDDENFYEGLPIEPIIAEPIFSYGVGYPLLSSLLPAQEMYDHDFSAVATNHSALAIRNLAIARNSNVSIKAMPGGLNLIQYTPQNVPGSGKPEVLDFNTPNGDVYNFQDRLLNNMQQMANMNSAIRGDVASNTAGVAIATLTTNALEFMSGYSKVLELATENILYWKIKILSKMVKEPRDITIATDDGISYKDTYKGEDLKGIRGIKIVATNPMMQTMAGRSDISEKMLNFGLLKSPQEFISILDGAPITRLWGNELSENDLILYEKEQILRNQMPQALSTDDHPKHIRAHSSIANNPAVRRNPQMLQVITQHIEEHLRLARDTDPMLQAMANTGTMPQGGPPPPPGPMGPPDQMGQLAPGSGTPGMPNPSGEPAAPAQQPAEDLLGRR